MMNGCWLEHIILISFLFFDFERSVLLSLSAAVFRPSAQQSFFFEHSGLSSAMSLPQAQPQA